MISDYADRWGLITGASSGIGAEFARRLAGRGMHLVLSARRRERLESLAAEIHTAHGSRCEIIPADLAERDAPRRLLEEIGRRGITLDVVVNNAGCGHRAEIAHTDLVRIMELVQVNVAALTEITYRVLPGMMERGQGAIVNVSSVGAFQPIAYLGAEAASNAYVLHFSEALWAEARERGVTVMALCPPISLAGRDEQNDSAAAAAHAADEQSAQEIVRVALKALERRRQYVITTWWNYLLAHLVRFANRRMVVRESMKYFRPPRTPPGEPPRSDPPPPPHRGDAEA